MRTIRLAGDGHVVARDQAHGMTQPARNINVSVEAHGYPAIAASANALHEVETVMRHHAMSTMYSKGKCVPQTG